MFLTIKYFFEESRNFQIRKFSEIKNVSHEEFRINV